MRILVVEDEKKVASFIRDGLQREGYAVDVAFDGEEGLYQAGTSDYDVIILDLMLPKLSGLDLLKELVRRNSAPPVLILTAKGAVDDKVLGLDSGASDYLVKPFAFAELSARVRALLRRDSRSAEPQLRCADLVLDRATRVVQRAGKRIELKPKEFALLEFLMHHAGRCVTRTMIIEHVWDVHFDSISNVVEVHINSLRNKIDRGFHPPLIHTVRGVGYALKEESE